MWLETLSDWQQLTVFKQVSQTNSQLLPLMFTSLQSTFCMICPLKHLFHQVVIPKQENRSTVCAFHNELYCLKYDSWGFRVWINSGKNICHDCSLPCWSHMFCTNCGITSDYLEGVLCHVLDIQTRLGLYQPHIPSTTQLCSQQITDVIEAF